MASFKSQMLWEKVDKGDLSAVHNLLESGNINLEERDENGQTYLMLASEKGELHIFRELLDADVDVDAVDNDNWNALLCAAKQGHLEIVIVLLEKSANIEHRDLNGWTPLMWACYKGHSMVVHELLDRDANPNVKAEHNMTCLAWAAGRGHLDIVKMLIKKGAKINSSDKYGTTPLIWAARKGHLEIVELLLSEGANVDASGMNSWTALLVATSGGYFEVVNALLEYDPNINATDKEGYTPLAVAAKEGYLEIVHALVTKGAYVNMTDRSGDTILIHAVKGGHTEVVKILLKKYVDVDFEGQEGKTALYWSVEKGHTEITKLLLDSDPDLEISSKDGVTPLLRAVRSRNEECVRLLLDKGARVSACDKKGDTALHIAIRARNKKITELLLRNPKNGRLLYRANKNGETPYTMDTYHQRGVLTQIFGNRNLNSSDAENLLGYDIYSGALADILSDPSLITPITVGLYAKWGSGKSFLLGRLTDEMKLFTMQNVHEHFTFTWVSFIFLLIINVIIGEILGLTVRFEVGLGVGFGLFILEYAFLGIILFCAKRYDIELIVRLSQLIGGEIHSWTLLLQTLFCNQQPKPDFKKMAETGSVFCVRFLFSECTRLTSVGGEKYLAATIATLCTAVENEYGMLVTRLFRVFKPPFQKYKKNKFKTLCCIPYFVFVILFLLILAVGIAMVRVYGISGNTIVNAVLISFAAVIGLTLISNMFLLVQVLEALIISQKARVLKSADQIAVIKMEGFMEKLKEEVDLMSEMVNCMDFFTSQQTRLVIIIDGLDSCEQEKVLQVLDTVNALFAEDNSPFITILAVDPHIIIKGIEQNLKSSFHDSNINGYDYLRNVVQLPFYLQAQGTRLQRLESVSAHDTAVETPSGKTKINFHHQDSNSEKLIKRLSRKRQNTSGGQQFMSVSSMDLSNTIIRHDYFSDINPRSMKRLMNIVAVTARLLRAYNIDFNWHRLMAWINIIEQWPYRVSWIIYYYEESDHVDQSTTLFSLYQKVQPRIPATKEIDPLVEIDRDIRKLDAFLRSKSGNTPLLNVGDLKKFLSVTINLDPFLRKLIREMEQSAEAQRLELQTGLFPTLTRKQSLVSIAGSPFDMLTGSKFQPQAAVAPRFPMYSSYANQMMPFTQTGMMPMPFMHFSNPLSNQMYRQNEPSYFLTDYCDDIVLSTLTVEGVCKLLSKVDGITVSALPRYFQSVKKNNITGLVLASCDLEELGKVMGMTFGDWQLMKATIMSLRQAEQVMQLDQNNAQSPLRGSNVDPKDETDNSFNKPEMSDRPPVTGSNKMKSDRRSAWADDRKTRFSQNDTIVEQLTFETEMLREALEDFTEEAKEEDEEEATDSSEGVVRFQLGPDAEDKWFDAPSSGKPEEAASETQKMESSGLIGNFTSSFGKHFIHVLDHPVTSRKPDLFPLMEVESANENSPKQAPAESRDTQTEDKAKAVQNGKTAVVVMEDKQNKNIPDPSMINNDGTNMSETMNHLDIQLTERKKGDTEQMERKEGDIELTERKRGEIRLTAEVHVISPDHTDIPSPSTYNVSRPDSVSQTEDKESFV